MHGKGIAILILISFDFPGGITISLASHGNRSRLHPEALLG
jgi:hypothetical protein